MHLKKMILKNFGLFDEFSFEYDNSKKIHLIYGDNEAGKTTLFQAMQSLLCSMPKKNSSFRGKDNFSLEGELATQNEQSPVALHQSPQHIAS